MKKVICLILLLCVLFSLTACSGASKEKQYSVKEYRTTMEFHEDFKILQLTDLHFGIESDIELQLGMVKKAINEANPDLIILTGDNFMYASKKIVYNLISTINAECNALTEKNGRLTKFAITYGNHDNQGDYPRYYLNEVVKSFTAPDGEEIAQKKYGAFVDYENDNVFGFTNYYIDLVDDRSKDAGTVDVKYRIHMIDSNTYHFTGFKYSYDVIHNDQLDHAVKIYNEATADKDYIGMAFFHIPFHEYQTMKEQYDSAENKALIGQGEMREDALSGYENNGAYSKLREANIIYFSVGHDHTNYGDYIFNASSENIKDKAVLSFGVKATNQLYHDTDMIGYKIINLKDNMTAESFVSIENINQNISNVTTGYEYYGK